MLEEISLKEIIEILLKGKFTIVVITVISVVVGAAIHWYTPKAYKSTASILATPIMQTQNSDNDFTNKLILPSMDIESYSQQFLNNYTLSKTIEELDLKNSDGNYITYEALKSNVTVNNPKGTNLLNIEVSYSDPNEAAHIANALSRHFVDYVSNVYKTSAGSSADSLAVQLKAESENLDREAAKLRDYLTNSGNIDTLNSEINSLIGQITNYKSLINDLEKDIESDKTTLAQVKDATDVEDFELFDLRVNTDIVNSASYTGQYQLQLNTENTNNLQKMLLTLKITDIETRLVENINHLSSLTNKTQELDIKLSDLQAMRAQEQYRYNSVMREYTMAENIYQTYHTQYRQALTLETSSVGVANIKIISEAVAPIGAYNRNLIHTEAIAGILGLSLSVFAVLFSSYWKSSGVRHVEPHTEVKLG